MAINLAIIVCIQRVQKWSIVTVFLNGKLTKEYTLKEIRENIIETLK